MKFTPTDPTQKPIEYVIHDFDAAGVAMGMYNTDKVSSSVYLLLWFSLKQENVGKFRNFIFKKSFTEL